MLCFGRKKCLKKDDDFLRLQEEPTPTVKKTNHIYDELRKEKNYNNNIRNVASHRGLVPSGKQFQVLRDVSTKHRTTNVIRRNTSHSQTLDYKNVQNSNNIYRPGRNNVVVQRSHSAHYPTPHIIHYKEPVRATSHSEPRYAKLDDIHFDVVMTGSKSEEIKTSGTKATDFVADPNENAILEQTLAHLDDTLKDYCDDAFDSDWTDDETYTAKSHKANSQILTIDPLEKEQSSIDSGVTSPPDSLSCNLPETMQHGIISRHVNRAGNKRSTVSFRLPENHVDKPYNPLQAVKSKPKSSFIVNITSTNNSHNNPHNPKPKSIPCKSFTTSIPNQSVPNANYSNHVPTLCVWDSQNKLWHTKEGIRYKDNINMSANAHPFRGSFLNLFYGKYASNDVTSSDQSLRGKAYLAPGISQKIESFESLTDAKYGYKAKPSGLDPRRHSIAHY